MWLFGLITALRNPYAAVVRPRWLDHIHGAHSSVTTRVKPIQRGPVTRRISADRHSQNRTGSGNMLASPPSGGLRDSADYGGRDLPSSLRLSCEAGAGIEPCLLGLADRRLTTWLPRRLSRTRRFGRERAAGVAPTLSDGSRTARCRALARRERDGRREWCLTQWVVRFKLTLYRRVA